MEGKVAIVTGGAGGIGSAVCRAFAGAGVGVAIADMDGARAGETAAEVSSGGGRAIAVEVEVTSESSVIAAVQRTVDHFRQGRLSGPLRWEQHQGAGCWSSPLKTGAGCSTLT